MASAAAASVVDQRMLVELIGYSVLSAVASEAVAWWLIYSKPRYEKLSETFKKVSKRLEKKKEEPVLLKAGKKDKKLLMLEREFEVANRDLMAIKVRARNGFAQHARTPLACVLTHQPSRGSRAPGW